MIVSSNPATGEVLKRFSAYDDATIEQRLSAAAEEPAALGAGFA